ncbi:hypothetical protein DFP93_102399 [Aneurinibacillus soli]|uniref:Uncharacterized protein n=1 Tax=Aneurinibacillus soli TaxID=1500254 RepID=A0A0U5B9E1_9BACL|nr:hypothetical protein [Aneurinibacillus soli]PYE63710.1 hypothetical protein DFP93_102399 [Aneurinibacillus soli]BAU27357.1 hypothetical protein CB4_01531 [Aneurinibacillus soli]
MIQTTREVYTVARVIEQINDRLYTQLACANGWPERDEVAMHLLATTTVEQTWQAMTQEEKHMLVYMLFYIGHDMLTYRQMEQYAHDTSPLAAYSGLTGLRRRGLVYTLRRLWGEVAYIMPDDLQAVWRAHIRTIKKETGLPHTGISSEPVPALWDVLFAIVHTYRHEPIMLTKKGILPMKIRRRLQALIPYEEELIGSVYSQDADYTAREGFVLALLLHTGALRLYEAEAGPVYQVENERVCRLFAGRRSHVQSRVWQAIVDVVGHLHPLYPGMLEGLTIDDEIDVQALYDREQGLLAEAGTIPDQKAWAGFIGQVLPLLAGLGFGFCHTCENRVWFSWNGGRPSRCEVEERVDERLGYVQPTRDVLLLPSAPYDVRWEVGAYAELVDQQEVWTFRLTQQSVRDGMRSRGRADLGVLLTRIQGDIPESVWTQLERWMSGRQAAIFDHVLFLRCPDEAVADWLEGEGSLTHAVRERLNTCDFLIHEAGWNSVRAALEKHDIPVQCSGEAVLRPLVEQKTQEEGFKVESVFPALEDSLPELRDIPTIWYKNWQTYHASTLRNMLSKAQALGVPLRLEAGKNEWEEARVTEIRNEDGNYRVRFAVTGDSMIIPLQEVGRVSWKLPFS